MRSLLLLTILAIPAAAPAQEPTRSRPMSEMHGTCSNYRADLTHEFALMKEADVAVAAGRSVAEASRMPVSKPVALGLVAQGQVTFPVPPAQKRGGPDRFAGIVSLGELPKGQWRVSATSGVWVDLVSNSTLLSSPTFEMQTQCVDIFKSVVFELPAVGKVLLQINGAKDAHTRLLVTQISVSDD
jgi:hypothetical protein